MSSAVEKVLNIARNEIGYLEKNNANNLDDKTANAGNKNYTKYARDLDKTNLYNGNKQGYAWCFTSGTSILTNTGYKKIEDLVVGDKVLSAFGSSFNNVTQITLHRTDVIDFSVYGTIPMTVTKDHPILSKKRVSRFSIKKGFESIQFTPVRDLAKKDVVAIPTTPISTLITIPNMTLRNIGYAYAMEDTKTELIKLTTADEIKENPVILRFISDCDRNRYDTKIIPIEILFGSNITKRIFYTGFKEGCAKRYQKSNEFTTQSKFFALGMARIVFDLGMECQIKVLKSSNGEKEIISYKCTIIHSKDDKAFREVDKKLAFVPIINKGKDVRTDVVYTISTDGDNTYTANNIGVHNCDVFVDWCFVQAFGFDTARKITFQPTNSAGAGCTYSANYYKQNGRFYTSNPQPGDQIFFTNNKGATFYHTGLVEKVVGNTVYTIEGNTSSSAGVVANGGAVRAKSYSLSSSSIGGYGRPNYSLVDGSSTNNTTTTIVEADITYSPTKTGAVTATTSVNVRTGPSTSYTKIGALKKDTVVTIVGVNSASTWYKTKSTLGDGWISAAYIRINPSNTNTTTTVTSTGKVNATSGLKVRTGPGYNYDYVGALNYGAIVTIHESSTYGYEGAWSKVSGTAGWGQLTNVWVPTEYLDITTPTTKTTTANVNFRTGRGTSYTSMGTIPKGTVVQVSDLQSGWYKVIYNGKTGYCSAKYLK